MTSPSELPEPKLRPRDRIYDFALDRIRSLQVRETIDGAKMLDGWRRELRVMVDIKNLVEQLEQKELEAAAAADKRGRRT